MSLASELYDDEASARLYEAGRAGWPDDLIDDAITSSSLSEGDPICEIGAGTGKVTTMLARRGWAVDALEPFGAMAAVLRSKTRRFPAVTIHAAAFENWVPPQTYRLICAGESWHWLPRESRIDLALAALHVEGTLALFWNYPKLDVGLRARLEEVYAKVAPDLRAREPNADRPPEPLRADAELRSSGRFQVVVTKQYQWQETYTADRYVALLDRAFGLKTVPSDVRTALFSGLRTVIDKEGGSFPLPHEAELVLASPTEPFRLRRSVAQR